MSRSPTRRASSSDVGGHRLPHRRPLSSCLHHPPDVRIWGCPTQILAEAFRNNGYAGVIYKSLLGQGKNIAFFNIDAARQRNCFLFKVKYLFFKFEEASNPYYLGTKTRNAS